MLSAGIHGNETAPIEQLLRLMEKLVSQSDYRGHALLFIFGNIPAMQKAKRYLDYDMNRTILWEAYRVLKEMRRGV